MVKSFLKILNLDLKNLSKLGNTLILIIEAYASKYNLISLLHVSCFA